VIVTDRSVVDNFAYYLRVTNGADPFAVEPLIRHGSVIAPQTKEGGGSLWRHMRSPFPI